MLIAQDVTQWCVNFLLFTGGFGAMEPEPGLFDEAGDYFGGETPGTVLELPDNLDLISEICSLPELLLGQSGLDALETEVDNNLPSVAFHDDTSLKQTFDQQFDTKHLEAVVDEAHIQNGIQCNLKLPWESGIMSNIFGNSSLRLLPKVETPIGHIDLPVGPDVASSSKVPVETSTKTVFENCVKFSMNRTKLDSEEAQWDIVMQRWESVIMHAPEHSKIGRYVSGLDREQTTFAIRCVFKGKGIATLRKRSDGFKKFAEWYYGSSGPGHRSAAGGVKMVLRVLTPQNFSIEHLFYCPLKLAGLDFQDGWRVVGSFVTWLA